jgi:hypothetical protein
MGIEPRDGDGQKSNGVHWFHPLCRVLSGELIQSLLRVAEWICFILVQVIFCSDLIGYCVLKPVAASCWNGISPLFSGLGAPHRCPCLVIHTSLHNLYFSTAKDKFIQGFVFLEACWVFNISSFYIDFWRSSKMTSLGIFLWLTCDKWREERASFDTASVSIYFCAFWAYLAWNSLRRCKILEEIGLSCIHSIQRSYSLFVCETWQRTESDDFRPHGNVMQLIFSISWIWFILYKSVYLD